MTIFLVNRVLPVWPLRLTDASLFLTPSGHAKGVFEKTKFSMFIPEVDAALREDQSLDQVSFRSVELRFHISSFIIPNTKVYTCKANMPSDASLRDSDRVIWSGDARLHTTNGPGFDQERKALLGEAL